MSTIGTIVFELHSDAFGADGDIQREHTCDGADRSPPLVWDEPPAGAQSLALIVHDPDAPRGDFTHWVLFDLPPDLRGLDAGVPTVGELPNGARQGRNDFGRLGYGGPCPPPDAAHRYDFELYALDVPVGLGAGATRAEVEAAMQGHVAGQARLVGRYARQASTAS
jgi:Raf kinase inhibitor-like YbhB/YbcL family protein